MKPITALFLIASITLVINNSHAQTSVKSQNPAKAPFTEGVLETRVTVAGLDMGFLTEGLDYSKGDLKGQAEALYAKMPKKEYQAFQTMVQKNPLIGLAMALTPPRGTLYVRNGAATVRTKGLGYALEHYHNSTTDEAFVYTTSLIQPGEEVTAKYRPSAEDEKLFSADKLITADKFNIKKEPGTIAVAGYTCSKSVYTPKTLEPQTASMNGMVAPQLYKLIVYTSSAISKEINFSHPYYLPEDHGILRIDIFFDEGNIPTMVYEITAVKPGTVTDEQLTIKKTEPLYTLTDMQYGMKVFGIMMGGMSDL